MSSSSNARVLSRTERRTATENGTTQPRAPPPPGQQERGSRNEWTDPQRTQSPHPSATSSSTHRRTASGTQRTNRNVEERRTERVQVATRETLTRTRSPERRPGPSVQQTERSRAPEANRAYSGDSRPKLSKTEAPPGMIYRVS